MKATSRTTTFRGWGSITGKTEENIAEIGRRTWCTERDSSPGSMERSTMATIKMTRKKGSGNLSGLTERFTEVSGRMVSSMVKVASLLTVRSLSESGRAESVSNKKRLISVEMLWIFMFIKFYILKFFIFYILIIIYDVLFS